MRRNGAVSLPSPPTSAFQTGKHWRALDSRTRKTASSIFSHSSTLSAPKPASFWREKRGTIVILVRGFFKKCCRVKTSQLNTIAVLAFFELQGSDTSYKDN